MPHAERLTHPVAPPASAGRLGAALGALALLVPKCPLCYTAYCSAVGAVGAIGLGRSSWYDRSLWVLLLVVLVLFVHRAAQEISQRIYLPALLAAPGATLLVAGKFTDVPGPGTVWLGLGLLLASSFSTWSIRHRNERI